MIEAPEARYLSEQLNRTVRGNSRGFMATRKSIPNDLPGKQLMKSIPEAE